MAMLLTLLYILTIALLAICLHRVIGLSLHARMAKSDDTPPPAAVDLPTVTVQLPVYNEKAVIHRLLDAVCALDYPRDRLQIQVLDDSTDETTSLIARHIEVWRQRGVEIAHIRRADRRGHKAGNLANALPMASGEFIAIFDADFVPEPAWLRSAVSQFLRQGSDRLGLVQTRWSHLNAGDSLLTYAQNLAVDQFAIAQTTRTRMGLWSSFYGSAGLWRKACILDAGGWSSDTFSEDLDMAYRAQLSGWSLGYDGTILAAAELPPAMLAYKQQQFFWSKGNMQVVRILWDRLLKVSVSPLQRVDAILFATWPVTHLLLLSLLIIQLLLLIWPIAWINVLDAIALLVLSAGFLPTLFDALRGRFSIPLHLALGTGISVNNTAGLLVGIFGPIGEDFRATTTRAADASSTRAAALDLITVTELAVAALALIGAGVAFQQGRWLLTLMLLTNSAPGFAWVGGQSVWEVLKSYSRRLTVTP